MVESGQVMLKDMVIMCQEFQKLELQCVMCFPSGVGGASRNYGHIAFVEKVNEDGSVVVSEMNIKGEFVISTRTIPKEVASKCYFIDFGL